MHVCDEAAAEYSQFIQRDPMRLMQYENVLRVLDQERSLFSAKILDLGCGEGCLARRLASFPHQCSVTAIDVSTELIKRIALPKEQANPLGISYHAIAADAFHSTERFDAVTSIMVLPHAFSPDGLRKIFAAAHRHLLGGHVFCSVVLNPTFAEFQKAIGNRMFSKEDSSVRVDFIDEQTGKAGFRSWLRQFPCEQYMQTAKDVGFTEIAWETVHPRSESRRARNDAFWKPVSDFQPYSLFIAKK